MGKRGPKPTPTATLRLHGSRRAKSRPDEPQAEISAPTMPTWLGKFARAEWRRVVPLLVESGIITKLDRGVLTAYCQAWGDFVECNEIMQREGMLLTSKKSGGSYAHPAYFLMTNAQGRLIKCGAELGLSPTSRPSIVAARPSQPDALDVFMRRKDGGKPGTGRGRKPS